VWDERGRNATKEGWIAAVIFCEIFRFKFGKVLMNNSWTDVMLIIEVYKL
jgi:hypothetical protein